MSTLRHAFASLRRSPGFALGVVLTFAVGIGLNTAIFSAAWTLLLAPLPVQEPERVVAVYQTEPGEDRRQVAPANFLDWRRQAKSFEGIVAWFQRSQVLADADEPVRIEVAHVSSAFFDLLGVEAARGRTFHDGEGGPLAVVSDRLWRQRLGGGPTDGAVLRLDGKTFTVVGVAPPAFDLPHESAAWTLAPADVPSIGLDFSLDPTTLRDARYLGVLGRLAPGVTVDEADAEMREIARQLEAAYPEANRDNGARVLPLAADLGERAREPLLMLGGGAACVLLVACINVAGLLLARLLARRRELAVRKALGAGHARLLADAAAESTLLTVAGAAVGLAVASRGASWLIAAIPGATIAGRPQGVPPSVVGFALLVSVGVALAAAATPAIFALGTHPSAAISSARGSLGGRRNRVRGSLVVAQVALALLLVTGALLMLRTVSRLLAVDSGFESAQRITLRLWLPSGQGLTPADRRSIFERAVQAAADLPTVERAGATLKLPLTGLGFSAGLRIDGRAFPPGRSPDVVWRAVTPDYFDTMGIRKLTGRGFDSGDRLDSAPVALVNRALAEKFWGDEDPIGRRLATGIDSEEGWVTIVGVVADTPQNSPAEPARPEMYRPLAQESRYGAETVALVVETAPGFALPDLRTALRAASPLLVIDPAQPLAHLMARATGRERVLGSLLTLFGATALLLAGVGIHGVLSLLVAGRRREMGLRLAVGATSRQLSFLVVRRGLAQAALGAAIGLPAAALLGRLLRSWLWGVEPTDPVSLGGALAALLLVAGIAAWLPALRAARLDPARVLHDE